MQKYDPKLYKELVRQGHLKNQENRMSRKASYEKY